MQLGRCCQPRIKVCVQPSTIAAQTHRQCVTPLFLPVFRAYDLMEPVISVGALIISICCFEPLQTSFITQCQKLEKAYAI